MRRKAVEGEEEGGGEGVTPVELIGRDSEGTGKVRRAGVGRARVTWG